MSTRLDNAQQVSLARRVLANAGQEQSPDGLVTCLCGLLLDLALPIEFFPSAGVVMTSTVPQAAPVMPAGELDPADGGRCLVLEEAATIGFPAIRDPLPPRWE